MQNPRSDEFLVVANTDKIKKDTRMQAPQPGHGVRCRPGMKGDQRPHGQYEPRGSVEELKSLPQPALLWATSTASIGSEFGSPRLGRRARFYKLKQLP